MIGDPRAFAVIMTISAVTIGLRALPFMALERLASSHYLRYLGVRMPIGVMIILVAYTLKDLDITAYPYGLPQFVALALSIGLYWITNNSLLSIGSALGIYLVTVNMVVS